MFDKTGDVVYYDTNIIKLFDELSFKKIEFFVSYIIFADDVTKNSLLNLIGFIRLLYRTGLQFSLYKYCFRQCWSV